MRSLTGCGIRRIYWLARCAVLFVLAGSYFQCSQASQQSVAQSIEELWSAASQAQQAQQYARAASLYRQILTDRPNLIEAEINLGLMLHLAGNQREAIEAFEHVLHDHPDLFVANFLAGMDNLKLGDATHALPYLERAEKEKPDQVEVRVGLGNSYLQLGDFPRALDQFTRATELNGRSADAWYGLGATYLSLEKQLEADLHRATSPFRAVLLGESYLQQGQAEKAVATLTPAIAARPSLPCARSILGFAYLRASKPDEALLQFQLDWDDHAGEGCLLAKLGEAVLDAHSGSREGTLRELRNAAAADSDFVRENRDWYLNDVAQVGIDWHELSGKELQDAPLTSALAAGKLMKEGHYSACSEALAGTSTVSSIENLRLESFCSFYIGRDDRVLRATETILKLTPGDSEALYWRVQSMERTGLAALTRGTELNPDSPSLHALMGDMLRAKGDLTGAATEYSKALASKPDFIAARLGLARALYSDHKPADAERQVQQVLAVSPDDPEANYLMGEILVNRMTPSDALPFLLKALQVSSEELPFVHADLSAVYEDRGEFEKAAQEMQQALSVDVDGSYYYRLGHLYLRLGNKTAATEALSEAARLRHNADTSATFQK